MRVIVLGNDLAGTTAALKAHSKGHEVIILGDNRSFSPHWTGKCDVYGPTAYRENAVPAQLLSRSQRLQSLCHNRPFHPYNLLRLNCNQITSLVQQAQSLLPDLFNVYPEPVQVLNQEGFVEYSDGTYLSLSGGEMEESRPRVVVGMEYFPIFQPEQITKTLENWGISAQSIHLEMAGWPLCQSPVTAARVLESRLSDLQEALASIIDSHGVPSDAIVLMPPILGTEAHTNRQCIQQISEHISRQVVELSGGHSGLFSVRLVNTLSSLAETSQIPRIGDRVTAFEAASNRVEHVQLESGRKITGDAFILTTGRFLSDGFTIAPPINEKLFKLPLFMDGSAINSQISPERLLNSQSTVEPPLFRAGLLTDERLQPLNSDHCISYDNLFCAGSSLGGTDVARDKSAWGVSLITGLMAADFATGGTGEGLWV